MNLTLCQIARKTLEGYFKGKKFIPDEKTKERHKEKQACFVTLTLNDELRGCIGSLVPEKELWKDVQENAINAATKDLRFPELSEEELSEIKIEISVLSRLQKINYVNEKDLLMKINLGKGYILKQGIASSTFLPQVWEKIPDKIKFLEQLSMKAGLNKNAWKDSELWFYTVSIHKED